MPGSIGLRCCADDDVRSPAVVQFEVSPDHVDDNPSSSRQVARSNSMPDLKLQDLKMQIGEQKKLLASHEGRLRQNPLWRESPGQPVCDAQLALGRLEREQQTLRSLAGGRHATPAAAPPR
jgi:hypothetical protein